MSIKRHRRQIDNVEQFVDLCEEMEKTDPINWSGVDASPRDVYKVVIHEINQLVSKYRNAQERELMMLVAFTKAMAENTIFKLKQEQANERDDQE
jgi:hypothetical protein